MKKPKFKKGDLVVVVDPTFDWMNSFLVEWLYGSFGVVTHVVGNKYFVTQSHPFFDGVSTRFLYSGEALEKIPTNYTFEDVL